MAKQLVRDYVFTPGSAGAGTIVVPCRYELDKLLLITNVTDNVIIYNFGDASFAGRVTVTTPPEVSIAYLPADTAVKSEV